MRGVHPQGVEDQVGNGFDVFFNAAANVVRLADLTLFQHEVNSPAVVVNVEPLAAVLAGFVQRHLLAGEQADDEEGNDFLRELIGAEVVGAVRQRHRQAKGVTISAHGQVSGGLGRVVRSARPIRRFLTEGLVRVEGQIAVHFTGGNVVEARHLGIGRGLQQLLRPHDIGLEKSRRIGQWPSCCAIPRQS